MQEKEEVIVNASGRGNTSIFLILKYGESSQSGPYAVLAPLSHVLMALSATDLKSHRFQHERSNATFFWLGAAWVKSRAERPSVSGVNRQLHVQIGCKLGIRNRKDELTKQAKRNKLRIKPGGN